MNSNTVVIDPNTYYIPTHFILQELVPPSVYSRYPTTGWQFLDPRLLYTLDLLRDMYGPLIVNTWHSKNLTARYGLRSQSGYRTREFYSSGEDYAYSNSQHKHGRAADIIPIGRNASVDKIRESILDFPNITAHKYITCVEMEVSWLHVDVRNYDKEKNGILKIYP